MQGEYGKKYKASQLMKKSTVHVYPVDIAYVSKKQIQCVSVSPSKRHPRMIGKKTFVAIFGGNE